MERHIIPSYPQHQPTICFFREMISYYSPTPLLPHYLTFGYFDIKIYFFSNNKYRTKIEHLLSQRVGGGSTSRLDACVLMAIDMPHVRSHEHQYTVE